VSTPSERVRLLIVDDSALMRKLLADVLKSAPEIEVVGVARDGPEALRQVEQLKPDVVTLDVEMPGPSGLEVLPQLLAAHNLAVIMVSSFTQEGADVTLAALERGAIDFFPKPDRHQITQLRESRDLLVAKIVAAASTRTGRPRVPSHAPPEHTPLPRPSRAPAVRPPETDLDLEVVGATPSHFVMIGISTGGPQALGQILPLLTPPTPPVLIVQHMPAQFTSVFAQRLHRACSVAVKEAEEGDRVVANRILIAPGGRHMSVRGKPSGARVTLSDEPAVSGHRPSVDVLFRSAARVFEGSAVGILMTGMGRDGADGCKVILAAGGTTFGQDEATSAVYGMNKAAFLEGGITSQFALEQLPVLIKRLGT
jgi:two-component system chemotaxis response regulator CheB